MKKSLILVLGMLLVLGFTASAFATDVTIGGEIRVRGEFNTNTTDFDDNAGDNASWYDQRVRLSVKAEVTPNTMGFIELESGTGDINGLDGGSNVADSWTWGGSWLAGVGSASGATGNIGAGLGNRKASDLRIRQAWILHKGSGLLGFNSGIKIGHIVFTLGNGLFFDRRAYGDDAIILFVDPTDELHVGLVHIKLNENNIAVNDDMNDYSLIVAYKGDGFKVSGDLSYLDVQDMTTNLGLPAGAGPDSEGLHFWNFGLRGDTTVAGLNLHGDLELQTGKAKDNYVDPTTGAIGERKYKGYAWMVGGDYNISDITVGLETAFGSGDKVEYSTTFPNGSTGSKNESFVTSLDNWDPHYTFVYEHRAPSAVGGLGTGLANTWYIKGSASTKPISDLTASCDIYYLRASKAVALMAARNSNGVLKTSKDLGWEIDGSITYQIDKNLVYFVEGGYLFAGSAYDYPDPANPVNGNNKSADNAYAVRHGLTLTF